MIVLYVLGYFNRNKQNSYAALNLILYMTYFYFSLNVYNNCVIIGVSVMNVTDFVTLYLHKRSFIETDKVSAHMYTSYSI